MRAAPPVSSVSRSQVRAKGRLDVAAFSISIPLVTNALPFLFHERITQWLA